KQLRMVKGKPKGAVSAHGDTADRSRGALPPNRVMCLDVGNELANEEIAGAQAAVSGVDVKAAPPFGRDHQKSGDLSLLAEIFDHVPSTGLEQALFVVAESVQKIEHRITTRRRAGSRGVIVGWQHNAVVDRLTENMAFQRVAVDAALSVGAGEKKRDKEQYPP